MTKYELTVPMTFEGEFTSKSEAIARARKMRAELDRNTGLSMYDAGEIEIREDE